MLIEIHPADPEPRKIRQAADELRSGGIVVYPTDTVYGLGCDIFNHQAVERVCKIRHLDPDRAMLSFICKDIRQVSEFAWQMDNEVFKLLKKNLPGPFTFILRSGNNVPKLFKNRKRTIGIRIPDNKIALALVEELGRPILSTSLKMDSEVDDFDEYYTGIQNIREDFEKLVDLIIDGGEGGATPSTLVDCSKPEFEIIREGLGELEW
ncbi:MAG: threonylcarbamoyl-AMP synthase [Bacteroidetes bacterium]|nr:threonylcarbamoyl-AMP synthase [Bacteroidota bacterium]